MISQTPDAETFADLVEQWGETGRLLAAIRRAELAGQTPDQSRRAVLDMLELSDLLPPDPARARSSGLVEMQRLFARWHGGGFFQPAA